MERIDKNIQNMEVFLIRHGETSYNAQKRYQGSIDIPLSEYGRQVLQQADFSPEEIYVSPMIRAKETATILFPNSRQIIISDFREMSFGSFEGRNYIEMEQDTKYRVWVDGGCLGCCPNGESREEFQKRTNLAFAQLMEQSFQEQKRQLFVLAHGGTQMAVLSQFGYPCRDYYQWQTPNGQGHVMQTNWDSWKHHKLFYQRKISFGQYPLMSVAEQEKRND